MTIVKQQYMPHPIYGIRPGFTIADMTTRQGNSPTVALNAVTVATTSAILALGARSIEFTCSCPTDVTQTFDIQVFNRPLGVDTLVATYTGLKHGSVQYVGGFENIDLGGLDLKIRVQNLSGAQAVTVRVLTTS